MAFLGPFLAASPDWGVRPWQSETRSEARQQPVENNMEHPVSLVVGLFVIACLASAFFYGLYPIVTCVVGLLVIAALLQLFGDGA